MSSRFSIGRFRNAVTIRVQTTAATAFLVISAVALSASGAAEIARTELRAAAEKELTAVAKSMANRLDLHMFDRYREIANLSKLEPLQLIWNNRPADVRVILEQLQASLPEYAWLGFATPDGTVTAATKKMLEGVSVASRPWFRAGLLSPSVQDVHDAKLLDKLLRATPGQPPFRFVDIAVPIRVQGRLQGVLGAHLSWSWAEELRKTVLTNHDSEADVELLVIGRDGNILAGTMGDSSGSSRMASNVKKGDAVFEELTADAAFVTAFARTEGMQSYPGLGWTVAARRPLASVDAPAIAAVQRISLIGICVAALASLLAWVFAGTVTKPLQRLTSAIDKIGRSETTKAVAFQRGSREAAQLSAAIRSLVRRTGIAENNEQTAREALDEIRYQATLAEYAASQLDTDIQKLREMADTDALTGLLNRRALAAEASLALASFKEGRATFAILMVDIDHFKQINDSFGHAVGDQVIKTAASTIREYVRAGDCVARFGGEEFVVVLQAIESREATNIAERLRAGFEQRAVGSHANGLPVTISIGLALSTSEDRDPDDVIEKADRALYDAKSSGRNCVRIFRQKPSVLAVNL
ncbi:diguanylate cyclase (GGDEF)-like protein [Rhizobium sp. PP-F2F-G20b]|nr:diguanylate cyclase (GGDEF)-like protein [Rhizobium sp. PP-F2F-G20b]